MPAEIERLYREHRAGLVRLVERELHDRDDAEDVVQTAFLDAQRALEGGTIPRNPRAWLAAIALNAAHRLRGRRLNAEPLEEYAVQEAARMPELRAALTGLPSEQRAAVLYRDLLGLSYQETAEQMGTTVNAVTMLLHRGRRRLRQTLGATTGGVPLWRWLRRMGTPQVAAAKGAGAIVVAAGLATGGVVTAGRAARAAAPTATGKTSALLALPVEPDSHARRIHPARTHARIANRSAPPVPAPAQRRGGDPTAVAEAPSSTVGGLTSALRVPTVVAVTTPIVTATVTTPVVAATTVTVATPVTTLTVPLP